MGTHLAAELIHLVSVQVWNTRSVDGVHRFLARVFRMCTGELSVDAPSREQLRLLHATIKRVPPLLGNILQLVDTSEQNISNSLIQPPKKVYCRTFKVTQRHSLSCMHCMSLTVKLATDVLVIKACDVCASSCSVFT